MRIFLCVLFIAAGCRDAVRISRGTGEKSEVYIISTENATYEYEHEAGGFRSIIDREGRDWIQFSQSDSAYYPASAASDYRGLPNLVFRSDDGGAGHPGFRKMTSEIIAPNQIRSASRSGKWSWTWTFYPDHAVMQVERVDPETPYWFLFEGPSAGEFSPRTHLWGHDLQGPLHTTPDLVLGTETYGRWNTVYFGDREYPVTFFMHQAEPDSLTDMFAYMGNSIKGNESSDGMTVFGFGRERGATPLMEKTNTFIIGFYNFPIQADQSHRALLKYIKELKPDKK